MKRDFYEDVVAETIADYEARKKARMSLELQWRLNMNFMSGNQYCSITPKGDVETDDKQYFWQEREVFNHVAPIVETRASRLNRVRASVVVRPSGTEASDVNVARLSSKILRATWEELDAYSKVRQANLWSEICGSAFYKIGWASDGGRLIAIGKRGEEIHEGEVELTVCPPYEIFPDNLAAGSVEELNSIIHAKAYTVEEIKERWGVDVEPEPVDVIAMSSTANLGGLGYSASAMHVAFEKRENMAIVVEKYVMPNKKHPYGRLIIVAGKSLLYYGDLPYENGVGGKRGLPFVRQCAIEQPGNFFGISIIERIIPVQRAYNAVKNRKHEFLNRISMGVLAVEDGSVDTDNLEEEGLSPGKVLIYRQGSTPPQLLNPGNVPNDFNYEEEKLLSEFIVISGVSELMSYTRTPTNVQSGVAMNLLIEQDDIRLSLSADSIRFAIKAIGYHILRLYKQFAKNRRLMRISGEDGDVEIAYFNSTDIAADDLTFETENELIDTPTARRNFVIELLKLGLLKGEDGKMDSRTKSKVFEMLGLGNWEAATDLEDTHARRASRENIEVDKGIAPEISELDDHSLHIAEHTRHLLSEKVVNNTLLEHVKEHLQYRALMEKSEENQERKGE